MILVLLGSFTGLPAAPALVPGRLLSPKPVHLPPGQARRLCRVILFPFLLLSGASNRLTGAARTFKWQAFLAALGLARGLRPSLRPSAPFRWRCGARLGRASDRQWLAGAASDVVAQAGGVDVASRAHQKAPDFTGREQVVDRVLREAGDPLRGLDGPGLHVGQLNFFSRWKITAQQSDGLRLREAIYDAYEKCLVNCVVKALRHPPKRSDTGTL